MLETSNPLIFRPDDNGTRPAATAAAGRGVHFINVTLDRLRPSPDNPRMTREDLADMKENIRKNRLIQALSGRPDPQTPGHYVVFEGCLRLQSLQELQEEGHVEAGYEVPVLVHPHADGRHDKKLGIIANTLRKPLHPLDEARAWDDILQTGAEVKDLALQAGVSLTTIRRRLALNRLNDAAKEKFYRGEMGLSQAQALCLGSPDEQKQILEQMARYRHVSTESIHRTLFSDRPTKAAAAFDLERYTGSYTTNLFADDAETYFDDVEQFYQLQKERVKEIRKAYQAKGADFVVVAEHWWQDEYKYKKAGGTGSKPKGVAIIIQRNGALDVRERLIPNGYSPSTTQALDDAGKPAKAPKPPYGTGIREDMNRHKTLAVQDLLLQNPRKAKEVAVYQMLVGSPGCHALRAHDALRVTARLASDPDGDTRTVPGSYRNLHDFVAPAVEKLLDGLTIHGDKAAPVAATQHVWYGGEEPPLYERLKELSDDDLEALHLYLPVAAFGPDNPQILGTRPGVFNSVAGDLGVRMREFWTPDAYFFSQRTKDQLEAIARATGLADEGTEMPAKKTDLVHALVDHFRACTLETAQWLPGPMRFPAVDDLTAEPEPPHAD